MGAKTASIPFSMLARNPGWSMASVMGSGLLNMSATEPLNDDLGKHRRQS
jgi:hypothetical protein